VTAGGKRKKPEIPAVNLLILMIVFNSEEEKL